MTTERPISFIPDALQRSLLTFCPDLITEFVNLSKSFALFRHLLTGLLVIELLFCILVFKNYPFLFACLLGAIFLTLVSKILLNFYLQTRRPEQWGQLKEKFVRSCLCTFGDNQEEKERNLPISAALLELVVQLKGIEQRIYPHPLVQKVAQGIHYQDQFDFQEMLFLSSLEHCFSQIRLTPTDIEAHLALGNSYFALAKLYQSYKENRIIWKRGIKDQIEKKRVAAVKGAIQEFTILKEFAPLDPGVRLELASGYRSLNMLAEEMKEYEGIVEILPEDPSVLFRLGSLYFLLQEMAKGLLIYDKLFRMGSLFAKELIACYGKNSDQLFTLQGEWE